MNSKEFDREKSYLKQYLSIETTLQIRKAELERIAKQPDSQSVEYADKLSEQKAVLLSQVEKLMNKQNEIRTCIGQLSNFDYRNVLEQRYLTEMKWSLVARTLNISERTAKRYHNAAMPLLVIPEENPAKV